MIRFASIFALGCAVSAPAFAGKADDAWAACLWKQAPTSSQNWLSLTPAKKEQFLDKNDKEQMLRSRLQAACKKILTPEGKKGSPSFDPKSVRASLLKSKPETIGPDLANTMAYRCEISDDEVILGVAMGFGDPKDIRPRPPATKVKCQIVQEDGSLVDA